MKQNMGEQLKYMEMKVCNEETVNKLGSVMSSFIRNLDKPDVEKKENAAANNEAKIESAKKKEESSSSSDSSNSESEDEKKEAHGRNRDGKVEFVARDFGASTFLSMDRSGVGWSSSPRRSPTRPIDNKVDAPEASGVRIVLEASLRKLGLR